MSELYYVTTIIPIVEGKLDRAIEVFSDLARDTEASEPDVLKYEYFVETNGESGKQNVIIHEIHKNEDTFKAHLTAPPVAAAGAKMSADNFFAGPPDVRVTKPFAGFTR